MKTTLKIRSGKYIKKIPVTIETNGHYLHFFCGYDADLIDEFRAMDGARWTPAKETQDSIGYWKVINNERNQYAIQCLEHNKQMYIDSIDKEMTGYDVTNRPLFKHQYSGVDFILSHKRCMLAFEMGLGKTLTTIQAVEAIIKTNYSLLKWWLVAPYGAQQEWKRQLKKWDAKFDFMVVSTYESLEKYLRDLPEELAPDGIIFDESVKIKNKDAQRSQIAYQVCERVRKNNGYIILLSGAPAPKNPIDWWHQIECLQPGFIREGSPIKFMLRYANVVEVDHGFGPHKQIESWKEDELIKLGQRLAPIVLVKHRKECLDLPEKIFEVIDCSQYDTVAWQQQYRLALAIVEGAPSAVMALEQLRELSDGFSYRRESPKTNAQSGEDSSSTEGNDSSVEGESPEIKRVGGYVRTEFCPKIRAIKELLDFYSLENGGCGRLVIYAAFHASIDMLCDFCREQGWQVAGIDGRGWKLHNVEAHAIKPEQILEGFESVNPQNNFVIVANPGCVHGLTLSRTLALVYYSNSFSVDHRIQSQDRRDRPGMDKTKGTRIIDLSNLPTDLYIAERLKKGISIQSITLEEIKRCLI